MNSRDRLPISVIVVLVLIAAIAALLAPFMLASTAPPGVVRDTLGAPPLPPAPSGSTGADRLRVRMAARAGILTPSDPRSPSTAW